MSKEIKTSYRSSSSTISTNTSSLLSSPKSPQSGQVMEDSGSVSTGNTNNSASESSVVPKIPRSKSQTDRDRRRKKSASPLEESNVVSSTSGGESPVRRKSPARKTSNQGTSSTIWHKNSPRSTAGSKTRGNSPGSGGQPKVFNSSTGLFTPKTPKSSGSTPRDSKKSTSKVPFQIPRGVTASKTPSSSNKTSNKKSKHQRRWSTDQDVPPPIPLVNPIPTSSVVWQPYRAIPSTDSDVMDEIHDNEYLGDSGAEDMSVSSGNVSDRSMRANNASSAKYRGGMGIEQMSARADKQNTRPRSSSWGAYTEEDVALLSRLERLRQAEYELQRERQLLTEEMWEASKKRDGVSAINWRDEVSKLVSSQTTSGGTAPPVFSEYTPSSTRFDDKISHGPGPNSTPRSSKSNMAAIMHQKRNSSRGNSTKSSPKSSHNSYVHPVAIEHVHYQIADINNSDEDELVRTTSFNDMHDTVTEYSTERSLAPDANEMASGKSFEEEDEENTIEMVVSSGLSVSPVRNGTFAFTSRRPTGVPKLDLSQLTVHNKLIELEGSESSDDQPNNFKKNLDSSMSISSPRSAFSSPRSSRERSSSIGSSMSGSTSVTSSSFARV